MSLILYHYWRSSASWRVRWAIELKKIPCDYRAVDLLQGAEKKAEYLAHNPSGYVPCLIAGDFQLGESMAILEWLEEKYPTHPLLGAISNERAKIRQVAETINSGIQPLQNLDVLKKFSPDKEEQKKWVQHWIQRGMSVVESLLLASGNQKTKFCFGDSPSLADLCLIPQCHAARRFEVDLSAFPRCNSIFEHALSTEACIKSSPEAWQP